MAALNKCNPAQLLILHIIKFLIYTLCFHGPTHNSLVLNSWVVKTNTLDKCGLLYLLFFGWQFSFNLPQRQTSNSTLRKLSDLVCFVHPLCQRKTSLITVLYPQILLIKHGIWNGEYHLFQLVQDTGVPWKTHFSAGGIWIDLEVKTKRDCK